MHPAFKTIANIFPLFFTTIIIITSVSETIRKPLLVKAQTALKIYNKIWRKTIFNMADGIITPCNLARSWHWFRQWLLPAMWHVALESWQWIRRVAAPCNVAGGSGMTCHGIRPKVRHIGILHLVSTLSPVCEILSKSDHPQQKKMTSCQFSRWRISAIFDFMSPIMSSLKSTCRPTTSYRSSIDTIALNYLVFEKTAFFCILATDRQTNRWTPPAH